MRQTRTSDDSDDFTRKRVSLESMRDGLEIVGLFGSDRLLRLSVVVVEIDSDFGRVLELQDGGNLPTVRDGSGMPIADR